MIPYYWHKPPHMKSRLCRFISFSFVAIALVITALQTISNTGLLPTIALLALAPLAITVMLHSLFILSIPVYIGILDTLYGYSYILSIIYFLYLFKHHHNIIHTYPDAWIISIYIAAAAIIIVIGYQCYRTFRNAIHVLENK